MARMNVAAVAVLTLSLSGCATQQAPVDQIKYFSQAFSAVNTVGQPLLDELAVAETIQGKQIALRRAKGKSSIGPDECLPANVPWKDASDGKNGIISGFCSADAGFFAGLGDPPATAALRGGLGVVERYAEVLAALAEGRNVEQALGQLDALGQEVDGLLGLAGVAGAAIAPALGALRPLLARAAKQADAKEARRLILEGAPAVTTLIAALRQSTPAIFNTLIEAPSARLTLASASANIPADVARVEAYRITVSQYAILLGRLQNAWDATVVAAQSPGGGAGRLASLVAASAELRADADAVRRNFALLRSGAVPAR